MTLLARLIAKREGFGLPDVIPTERHNPGDLIHAPNASHEGIGPNDVGIEPSDEQGWADLEHQLQLYAGRQMTLQQMVYDYAPPPGNDSAGYLAFVCQGLGCPPETPVSQALQIP
jgi:hypothetical protein